MRNLKIKTKYDKRSYFQIDKQIFRKTQFNGTVAVFDNGKVKMNKGYGYQDIERQKNTANTMYLIGSAQNLQQV